MKPISPLLALIGLAVLATTCQNPTQDEGGRAAPAKPAETSPGAPHAAGLAPTLAVGSADEGQRPSLAPLVQQVRNVVVGVTTHTEVQAPAELRELMRRFFGQSISPQEETGIGSGIIIDPKGLVLTNNHVVRGADEVRVRTADGADYTAAVKGTDPDTDLAVLQLRDVQGALPAARLGSSESLRVGDYVVAIGNPFGLTLTVTNGIISAKSRVIGVGPYDEFLQTDAAINPGNSGGPLFDLDGNVVGINTAISASGQNIGFAVPIDLAKDVLPQLETKGRVVRGFLGIAVQDLTPELARAFGISIDHGAVVNTVEPDGPAAKAGLKEGDVIFEMNGERIDSGAQLSRRVALLPPGQKVALRYFRNGVGSEATATLAERPAAAEERGPGGPQSESSLGLTLQPVPPNAERELGVARGALVAGIQVGSRADRAGLETGDVIVEAQHKPVANPDDLLAIVRANPRAPLLIRVVRRGVGRYVVVPAQGD